MKNKWMIKTLISLAILGGGTYFLLQSNTFSLDEIIRIIRNFNPYIVLLALCSVTLQAFFVIIRLWQLMPNLSEPGLINVVKAVSLGQWLNTFAPARAGDIAKAVLVSKNSSADAVSVLTGAGVVIADKIVDITSILVLILVSGAYAQGQIQLPELPGYIVTLFACLAIILLGIGIWKYKDRITGWRGKVFSFFQGFTAFKRPSRIIVSLSFALAAWLCETIALILLTEQSGIQLNWGQAVYCLAVLNLAIAIPITIANVGAYEASIAYALTQFGVPLPEALAIATLHHVLQLSAISLWALAVVVGEAFFSKSKSSSEFRVSEADKKKAISYYEKASGSYDEKVSKGILKIPRDLERKAVLKFIGLDNVAPGALIDVGCGAGFYALKAKEKGWFVSAMDASPGMVSRIFDKVDEVKVVDIEHIEVKKQFDRVVCAGVLDFVLHPTLAFNNLCRLVAPGGKLILLVPRKGLGGLYYRFEKLLIGVSINLYTVAWLSEMAKAEGLVLVESIKPLPTNMAVMFERPLA